MQLVRPSAISIVCKSISDAVMECVERTSPLNVERTSALNEKSLAMWFLGKMVINDFSETSMKRRVREEP